MSTKINQLSSTDTLAAGDLIAIFDQSAGDTRQVAISLLTSYLQSVLTFTSASYQKEYETQYAAPSATGFSVTITDGDDDDENVHLILTPAAGYATGTIVLPASSSLVDKQRVLVNCTQAVTTLTIDKNGATALTGAPTALTANQSFKLKYDKPTSTWYKVD